MIWLWLKVKTAFRSSRLQCFSYFLALLLFRSVVFCSVFFFVSESCTSLYRQTFWLEMHIRRKYGFKKKPDSPKKDSTKTKVIPFRWREGKLLNRYNDKVARTKNVPQSHHLFPIFHNVKSDYSKTNKLHYTKQKFYWRLILLAPIPTTGVETKNSAHWKKTHVACRRLFTIQTTWADWIYSIQRPSVETDAKHVESCSEYLESFWIWNRLPNFSVAVESSF